MVGNFLAVGSGQRNADAAITLLTLPHFGNGVDKMSIFGLDKYADRQGQVVHEWAATQMMPAQQQTFVKATT